MIAGIGTDIVAVARLGRLYRRYGGRLLGKLLAPGERAAFDCARASVDVAEFAESVDPVDPVDSTGSDDSATPAFVRPARFLAKRFAAKEALGKALGIGVAAPATLPNVRVVHDAAGRPGFEFAPELAAYLAERGIGRAHLSLSDEADYAVAFVILESAPTLLAAPEKPAPAGITSLGAERR